MPDERYIYFFLPLTLPVLGTTFSPVRPVGPSSPLRLPKPPRSNASASAVLFRILGHLPRLPIPPPRRQRGTQAASSPGRQWRSAVGGGPDFLGGCCALPATLMYTRTLLCVFVRGCKVLTHFSSSATVPPGLFRLPTWDEGKGMKEEGNNTSPIPRAVYQRTFIFFHAAIRNPRAMLRAMPAC